MAMKKLLVGCLIISVLIGSSGAVLASSVEQGVPAINTENVATTIGAVAGKVVYSTHVQNVGWQEVVSDGDMSGTAGKALRLEGITIESGIDGVGISYSTHVQNIGWQDAVADGEVSGTEGKGLRLEGIRINLTGEKADQYDVVYRVHAQNVGWMGYALNGADAGTAGYGYRLEGIEIQIVQKGTFTGNTENAFKDAAAAMKLLYLDKLQEIKAEDSSLDYDYFLYDINGDGRTELVVKAVNSTYGVGVCSFYKITDDNRNVQKLTSNEKIYDAVSSAGGFRSFIRIPDNGTGLLVSSFYSYAPEINVDRITVSDSGVNLTDETTLKYGTDEELAFRKANPFPTWFDIDDTKPLL